MERLPTEIQLIAVGASAGGVTAIQQLLGNLDPTFRTPLVFVQHLPSDAAVDPSLIFSRHYRGTILEAIDKMPIEEGNIYFAPPSYHLLVERDLTFSLSQDEPVNFARPSIDVFFESIALNIGRKACGVLLTGANSDGARGLRMIQECGGWTIVQDPRSAEATTMPKSAIEIMKPNQIGTIVEISQTLSNRAERDVL